uniref:Uncharacterized protein n=1 Tax=Cyclophora tenuis TaxID=216820 RepID=A0A6U1NTU9_CYCTE|mmetsp:Transcript_1167/g.2154  ORF Transcript_1167/g.2154 Transcript_1167/m.2154 type:complete len:340 (+) Transcript_1167:70-1089(+)
MPRRSRRRLSQSDAMDEEPSTMEVLVGYTKSPYFFAGLLLFGSLAMFSDATVFLELLFGPQDTRFEGSLPNSLLTLNYPYTLMRSVVMEQPVADSDVPFFWHPHKSDEKILDKVLTNCYGVETIKLDSKKNIQQAKDVKIASRNNKKSAILSPFFPEAIEVLTPDNLGRAVCLFRHPLDYDFHSDLLNKSQEEDKNSQKKTDNYLIRYIFNHFQGSVGFKELGDAKQLVRDVCVVSNMDKTTESIERAAAYFGWALTEGSTESCVKDIVDAIKPTERYVDHDTPEWEKFYRDYKFDCQLYEFTQQAWRAQIQTIVPLALQQQRENQRLRRQHQDEEEAG